MPAASGRTPRIEASIETKTNVDLLLVNALEVFSCVPVGGDPAGRLTGAAVAISNETIVGVGPRAELEGFLELSTAGEIDLSGKLLAPGFVDSHTHLIFGGSRAKEYGLRMTRTAAQVAELGIPTGIPASVAMTREESMEELRAGAARRVKRMLDYGTTTIESKSGYGLSVEHEVRMLEVNRWLNETEPADIISTFLGAHEFPEEMTREDYIDLIIGEMIPRVAGDGLAEFCDVYCDDGYYTAEESRRILAAGMRAGLRPKIHTDAYSQIGGAALAADLGVVSADHLNYTGRATMRKLAEAEVVGVVMPGLDFCVQHPRPFDGRAMLDEGLTLALATDFCPACWIESMQMVMALACRLYRFSPAEALAAATIGGARALGLTDRGTIAPGQLADMQVWDVPSLEDVIYRIGNNAVEMVIKRGQVYSSPKAAAGSA